MAPGDHIDTTDRVRIALAEQARIGRSLHDGPVQDVTAALIRADIELDRSRSGASRQNLEQIVALLGSAIRDLRSAVDVLVPPDLGDGSLIANLALSARRLLADPEVSIDLTDSTETFQPAAVAETLYLVGREAIANIARHANASRVTISLDEPSGRTRLLIGDDGIGFDPTDPPEGTRRHFGLGLMRERVDQLGGELVIRRADGGGTTVEVVLPHQGDPEP